jgi:hypothetical protein
LKRSVTFCFLLASYFCGAQPAAVENPLFNTFKQGNTKNEGNSATVALIKAAIGNFGINNVFRYVYTDNAGKRYNVRLRNEKRITLTFAELDQAKSLAAFKERAADPLSGEIKKYAVFCFAVMAKKLQDQYPHYSYAAAIADLNDGYELAGAASLLGLQLKKLVSCAISDLSQYNHIIVRNNYHIAYAHTGFYDECNTQAGMASLNAFRDNHAAGSCSFKKCNINEAFRVDE